MVVVAVPLNMVNAWQKFVIPRMGKLRSLTGAELPVIIPVLETEHGATILVPALLAEGLNPSPATRRLAMAANRSLSADGGAQPRTGVPVLDVRRPAAA
jgi:hypothetical protein